MKNKPCGRTVCPVTCSKIIFEQLSRSFLPLPPKSDLDAFSSCVHCVPCCAHHGTSCMAFHFVLWWLLTMVPSLSSLWLQYGFSSSYIHALELGCWPWLKRLFRKHWHDNRWIYSFLGLNWEKTMKQGERTGKSGETKST